MINQVCGTDELQSISTSLNYETKIAVGSINPVKIQAVKNALNDEKTRIVSCSALSMVRPQPLSDEETLQGAINRAKDCLEKQILHGLSV